MNNELASFRMRCGDNTAKVIVSNLKENKLDAQLKEWKDK